MWWNDAPQDAPEESATKFYWRDVLEYWTDVELDLHTTFGVDVEDGILDRRTWRWLEARIADLATAATTRTAHALAAIRA